MKVSTRLLLFNRPAGMSELIQSTQPTNLIGYWPLGDPSGSVADDVSATNADGAYAGTVTLAQAGIGDGSRSALFGGGRVSLAANLSALNTAFNVGEITIFAWVKIVNAGVWTDGTARFVCEFGADANNRIRINRQSANNAIDFFYTAGATAKSATYVSSGQLTWIPIAMTVSKAADQLKAYALGAQVGITATGLGVWAGSLASSFSAIADFNSAGTSNSWSGYLAHVALWKVALTAAEIARLSPAIYQAA